MLGEPFIPDFRFRQSRTSDQHQTRPDLLRQLPGQNQPDTAQPAGNQVNAPRAQPAVLLGSGSLDFFHRRHPAAPESISHGVIPRIVQQFREQMPLGIIDAGLDIDNPAPYRRDLAGHYPAKALDQRARRVDLLVTANRTQMTGGHVDAHS